MKIVRLTDWGLWEDVYHPDRLGHAETLFTLGNGYLGTRGATEEGHPDRHPGVYLAGLYDRAPGEVAELVNLPDWTSGELDLAGERFDLRQGRILAFSRRLDFGRGVLTRRVRWESPAGRLTRLEFRRFVSAADSHLMGQSVRATPENYSGLLTFCSRLDGEAALPSARHLAPLAQFSFGARGIGLLQETKASHNSAGLAAAHRVSGQVAAEKICLAPRAAAYRVTLEAREGRPCELQKLVTVYASRDPEFRRLAAQARAEAVRERAVRAAGEALRRPWAEHLAVHRRIWAQRWQACDVRIAGDRAAQRALRFALFHLLQMAPWHDERVSIPAKGLSGEGYRGHIFWDTDLFMLPFFLYCFPAVARNLLLYRHHTLPGALAKAKRHGYAGAMYAWESAGTGREETPRLGGFDSLTRRPVPVRSGDLEQHISSDVAYAFWQHYLVTGDVDFLARYGARIICLTARFWASRATGDPGGGRALREVMGPDEFAECVDNDFYTNSLVQWHLQRAAEAGRLLAAGGRYGALAARLGLTDEERARWQAVADGLKRSSRAAVWEQFDGFFDRETVDAVRLRNLPGGLQAHLRPEELARLQVIKQPDVLMLLYLLGEAFTPEEKLANWHYYEPRTVHDSSLSPPIHAALGAEVGDQAKAYAYFRQTARLDLDDLQGNTATGLHAAAMGGLWQAVVHGFGGVRLTGDRLTVTPALPRRWRALHFRLVYRGAHLEFHFTRSAVTVAALDAPPAEPVALRLLGRDFTLDACTREASLRL